MRVHLGYGESRGADTEIGLVAGNPLVSIHGGDGGPAADATFARISGLAVAADGSVYVSDSGAHRVRRFAPNGTIETVAGNASRATPATVDLPPRPASMLLGG